MNLKLEIELVPSSSWYNNVRKKVTALEWDKIRKKTYSNYSYKCGICGVSEKLNCHEIWQYDDKTYIQQLSGYIALCDMCHHVKHLGFSEVLASKGKLDYEKVVEHFMKINKCNKDTFEIHRKKAIKTWERRSKHNWSINLDNIPSTNNKKTSWTQYSIWNTCPNKFKLKYIDHIDIPDYNINLLFGSAMHITLQSLIKLYYTTRHREYLNFDIKTELKNNMISEFKQSREKYGNIIITQPEMEEYYSDGIHTLAEFRKKLPEYFKKQKCQLYGIEFPLDTQVVSGINIIGNIDLIIQENNSFKLYDIKTSKMGWHSSDKSNSNKTDQVILYKKYFSEQVGIPLELISTEFLIFKRKIYENNPYPTSRIQKFQTRSGPIITKRAITKFEEFISKTYYNNSIFNKTKYLSNCRYCIYFTKHCDGAISNENKA